MARDWEVTFALWGTAPSETETARCENAERAVRKALAESTKLSGLISSGDIEVFTQGSYANRTNVRQDSDVDVCVLYSGAFFGDYSMSQGVRQDTLGFSDGTYIYSDFKNDVSAALTKYFGAGSVTRGNKAFDIHANTYRIDADVVPCFQHRRYYGTPQNNWYVAGTQLHPDNGGTIVNWPKQNYDNGVEKNTATDKGFKRVTRILKRLRNEMEESGIATPRGIPSYLIECLVWNVPNNGFNHLTHREDVRFAIAHLWNETRADAACSEWGEVNELKYLFRGQKWTRSEVNDFLQSAWDYLGFQ
jgi:hypothetical protein